MSEYNRVIREYEILDPYPINVYFNPHTITYGELADGGYIDWSREEFSWAWYSEEQRDRLQKMIARRFWLREISIVPPEAWRLRFIETLDEAMRVATHMYAVLDEGQNALVEGDEFHKSRSVDSDFPATLLNGSGGDYASNGRDLEYETIRQRSMTEAMAELQSYQDPDLYILDKLESCFSSIVSVNVNAY